MPSANQPLTDDPQHHGIDVPINIDLPSDDDAAEATAAMASGLVDSALQHSICQAVQIAAGSQGFFRGQIGVLVTDDPTIQQINLRHLGHDYATDVISFDYHRGDAVIEGELVVSRCTAERLAAEIGWDWRSELLLYVIHGTLHICGLEDTTEDQRQQMRRAERAALRQLAVCDDDAFSRGFGLEMRHEKGAVER